MATYTERYIYAATRSVPEKSRGDLAAELGASIDDAIEARVDGGERRDVAERAVLTDMGDPDRLAADYTDRPAYLLGPRYYFEWLRLVKFLFAVVLPIAVAGVALGQLLSGHGLGELIAGVVVGALTIALHLLFWPTLVFVLLERSTSTSTLPASRTTKAAPWGPWTLERLPEIGPSGMGTAELVSSLVYVGLMIGALLWDQFVGFVFVDGEGIPVLSPALWSFWIPLLLLLLLGEAAFAIVLYRTGRWTPVLAIVNALLAVAFAVALLVPIVQGTLFNPAAFEATAGAEAAAVIQVVGIVVGCVVAAVAVWDVVDGMLKTARGGRPTILLGS
jgi:hypothetical protein